MDLDADLEDPAPDPALFVSDLQDQQKIILISIFLLIIFEGIFTSFFQDKKSQRSQKTLGINVFLLVLLDARRIRIRISD